MQVEVPPVAQLAVPAVHSLISNNNNKETFFRSAGDLLCGRGELTRARDSSASVSSITSTSEGSNSVGASRSSTSRTVRGSQSALVDIYQAKWATDNKKIN